MQNKKTILIIEDDANLLYGMQAKFKIENFDVIVDQGINKDEILDKIITSLPDYIILDIMLPGFNGLMLIKDIKSKPQISRIPIFVFTNLSDNDSREQAKKLGADIYFIKSDFNLDEFIEKIKKIIENMEKIK